MEVLRLHGYTEPEKVEIAKQFLVKKQMAQAGLTDKNIKFSDEAIAGLIRSFTREAGVRNLEREIGNICRKVARKVVKEGADYNIVDNSGQDRTTSWAWSSSATPWRTKRAKSAW
jgi:ATP-dependent Lon protease